MDLSDKTFGRWKVIKYIGNRKYLCKCECGNVKDVYSYNLTSGKSLSCGCLRKEMTSQRNGTHHKSHTKLYYVWYGMKKRCYTPSSKSYKDYGAKGIKICDEWFNNFQLFYDWSMANGYRENLSIDRIDNNGDYEPNNCRWVDRLTQANNNSRNVIIDYKGQKHTIAEWSRILNMNDKTLRSKLKRHTVEEIMRGIA